LYVAYPDTEMQLDLSPLNNTAPVFTVDEQGIHLTADFLIEFSVLTKGQVVSVAQISFNVGTDMKITVNASNVILGAIKDLNIDLTLIESPFKFNQLIGGLQTLGQAMINGVVLPMINSYLQQGIPLPSASFIQAQNISLVYQPHVLSLSTDIAINF